MGVHSNLLGATTSQGTGESTLYTVPTGKRTIVKSIVVVNTNAAANFVAIEGYSSAPALLWFFRLYMAAVSTDGDTKMVLPWIVMNEGQTLRAVAHAASVGIVVSGSELVT